MASRKLFVVWSHPLFRESMNRLLDHPEVVIVGTATDYGAALARLETLKPDVIIVEETQDATVTSLDALQFLKACTWGPSIIRLSMHDNELWVYHQERWSIGSTEDFIRLVREA